MNAFPLYRSKCYNLRVPLREIFSAALLLALVACASSISLPIPAATPTARVILSTPTPADAFTFRLIGRNDLGARRANGGLAIARDCAYVGSRGGDGAIAIVDISTPANPSLVGRIPATRGIDPREVRAVNDLNLLVVMTMGVVAQPAANGLHLYDIRDCRAPKFIAAFDFGDNPPHEFYLWRDPQRPARLLAYVAMFSTRGIEIIDVSDFARPTRLAQWNEAPRAGVMHSVSVSNDGRRAYIANWDAGLLIADSSEIAEGKPSPTLRAISHLPYANSSTHSAISIPARRLLILTDENYACLFGFLRVVDVAGETRPKIAGDFRVPQNDAAKCEAGIFTSHNPLAFKNIILVTWYSSGLFALDISDAAPPRALAQFRNGAEQFWSYPIVRNGLIYVVSIEGGLYVLEYAGTFAEEIRAAQFAEGNSNAGSQ